MGLPGGIVKGGGTKLVDEFGDSYSVQNPSPSNGDSVYEKDIWESESVSAGWTGDIVGMFNNLHSVISNESATNPKELFIHFNRTVVSNTIGLGCALGLGDFSNVKIEIVNSGDVSTTVIDESGDSTKYTSRTFQLPVTAGFNALRITFHTADHVHLTNCVIIKTRGVVARGQGVKPDGTVTDINVTQSGNQKVSLEEFENDVSVNSNKQLKVTQFLEDGIEGALLRGLKYAASRSGIDFSTEALEVIDYSHHEIHSGNHYYVQGFLELDDLDEFYIKLVTPDSATWSHFIFDIKSTGICTTYLDEAATGGMTGGANVLPINNNRNSSNVSGMVMTSGVTAPTGYAKRLEADKWGANGFKESIGGGSGRDDELLLKQNTVYCRTLISGADSNIIQFKASWYEHVNKN